MASSPTPATDSRQPGFNPEVEASHAAKIAAAQAVLDAAKAAATAAAATPAAPRAANSVIADIFTVLNGLLGNVSSIETLIAELRSL